ncbi:MAG: FadR family transcriptional regulator [Deltaproteobacteria bacterium]|nr:FadR family transcriptional regulator [Deltaproteobacteria bacterium]
MFTKVRQVRAFESVIHQMEAAILQGRLSAGDRLPSERELQVLMDVSRNTLRESLRVLEQKGLVEIRKGHRGGIFVKEINADSMIESLGLFVRSRRITMEEISEFRQDLEGLLTRRAALRAGSKNMGELKRLLKQAADLAQSGAAKWDEFMQVDREIHLALARIAGNPLHHFFLETVHSNFHRYHISAYLPRDEETIQTTLAELKEIVTAVSRGDAERAESLARGHVHRATTVMQQRSAAGGRARSAVRAPVKHRAPSS